MSEPSELYVETINDLDGLDKQFDNSVDRLYLNKTLDFLPMDRKVETIQKCNQKLSHGGSIEIMGCDLLEISRGVFSRNVQCADTHQYMGQFPLSIFDMIHMLELNGLKVMTKRCNNYTYFVKAERP